MASGLEAKHYVSDKLPGDSGTAPDFGRALVPAQRDRLMTLFSDRGVKIMDIRHNSCRNRIGVVALHSDLGLVAQWYEKNLVIERIHENGGWVDAPDQGTKPDEPLAERIPYLSPVIAIIGDPLLPVPRTVAGWCPRCANEVSVSVRAVVSDARKGKDTYH